jgi:cation diffusion facilitator CzcD-associated flavoprotein CzcO
LTQRHVAVIGGGYSGTMQAIALLRQGRPRHPYREGGAGWPRSRLQHPPCRPPSQRARERDERICR